MGLPLPAAVTLISAGMKVRTGQLSWPPVMAVTLAASLIGHSAWYLAGRRMGVRVLRRLCQMSVEPEACLERIERLFTRWGPVGLVLARFVPGLDILAQPVAAVVGMHPLRWLVLTLLGGIFWSGSLMALGFAVGDQVQSALTPVVRALGLYLVPVIVGAILLGLVALLVRRHRSLLGLDVQRISAPELKRMLDGGEPVVVFDLRSSLQLRLAPISLPGAQRFTRAALEGSRRGGDGVATVVLFCNCLHEIASARLALTLGREGFERIFPLDGGLDGWLRLGYPTAPAPRAAAGRPMGGAQPP